MFCIVGLGNPGPQYRLTRHNAGFLVVETVARVYDISLRTSGFKSIYGRGKIEGRETILIQPQTYMNLCGEAVQPLVAYYKIPIEQILLVSDDLDLPYGAVRLKLTGGAGGHRGLRSIFDSLGTNAVPRLKIGIGRPGPDEHVADYVLESPKGENFELWQESIERAASAVKVFITEGPEYVMNHFNGGVPKA